MLPINQLPMMTQDDYNDYIEFQNFKKLKYAQQQFKNANLPMLSNQAAFNQLFNSSNVGTSLNSIFPLTSSASIPTTSMLANSNFYQPQHPQQQQQQQSTQIIPKVLPQGMPIQFMRQHQQHQQHQQQQQQQQQQAQQQQSAVAAAATFLHYKNVPNFPGLKGGASNYSQQPPSSIFMPGQMPPSMPIQSLTPKVATPSTPKQLISPTTPKSPAKRQRASNKNNQHHTVAPVAAPASPEIIVDDRPEQQQQQPMVPEKKTRIESEQQQPYTMETNSFLPKLPEQSSIEKPKSISIPTLPSIDNSLKMTSTSTAPSSSSISLPECSIPQQQRSTESMEDEETHIIITARPRVPDSTERDESYTTEEDSDYDTNLRPKETPLQYKERMMERVMDKAKRKNEASKRSREKRKREHHDRQAEKQRLEKRNMELTEKLMNLKEALKRLRPQICSSCNEQVQKFLDQCQNSREGMNVFVLRPCKQDKCPGNKSVGREINKFARS